MDTILKSGDKFIVVPENMKLREGIDVSQIDEIVYVENQKGSAKLFDDRVSVYLGGSYLRLCVDHVLLWNFYDWRFYDNYRGMEGFSGFTSREIVDCLNKIGEEGVNAFIGFYEACILALRANVISAFENVKSLLKDHYSQKVENDFIRLNKQIKGIDLHLTSIREAKRVSENKISMSAEDNDLIGKYFE